MRGTRLRRAAALLACLLAGTIGAASGEVVTWNILTPERRDEVAVYENVDIGSNLWRVFFMGYEGVDSDWSQIPWAAVFAADAPKGAYGDTAQYAVPGSEHLLFPISGAVVFTKPDDPGDYEIRVFPNTDHETTATDTHRFTVYVDSRLVDDRLELRIPGTASPLREGASLLANDLLEVSFAVPMHLEDAWVGLFRSDAAVGTAGAGLEETLASQPIMHPGRGSLVFRIPAVEGACRFVLFEGEDSQAKPLATSQPFEVRPWIPRNVTESADVLYLDEATYLPGDVIWLRYNKPLDCPDAAWVGLFTAEGAGIHNESMPQQRGTLEFRAPLEPGQYEFRMVKSVDDDEPAASLAFSVAIRKEGEVRLADDWRPLFRPEDRVEVRFNGRWWYLSSAWVGLFRAGDVLPSTTSEDAARCAIDRHSLGNQVSGSLWFSAPTQAGEYEFIMYERERSVWEAYVERSDGQEMDRKAFEVWIDKVHASMFLLDARHRTYNPGQEMRVKFTAALSYMDGAWIALGHSGARVSATEYISYQFLGKDRVYGVLVLTAPEEPGDYHLVMYDRAEGTPNEVYRTGFSVIEKE